MNALEQFYASLQPNHWFMTREDLKQLIRIHRLGLVLMRFGTCRMLAPAQDVTRIIGYVTLAGDHLRDISIPRLEVERAKDWRPEPEPPLKPTPPIPRAPAKPQPRQRDPWDMDFGGVFDGSQVTSDADPGL